MDLEILNKINDSIDESVKIDFKRRICTSCTFMYNFSRDLKNLVDSNLDIKSILFKDSEDAIYFSGDILSKTLYHYWITGGSIYEHFIENARSASYSYNFKCLW